MDRIAADPRHHDIAVLRDAALAQRRFGRWTMLDAHVEPGAEPAVDQFLAGLLARRDPQDVERLTTPLAALAQRH